MAKTGKRLIDSYKEIFGAKGKKDENRKPIDITDACSKLKKAKPVKFDETVEIAVNLGLDTRKSNQQVRGQVNLPHGIGKEVRVAVFAKDAKAEEARKAGADIVGAEDLAEKIEDGEINFDRCIATPDLMAVVGKLGKVLGPRGLMPNPRLGTVTVNVEQAVAKLKAGAVQFRADKGGVISVPVGKLSFDEKKLEENIISMIKTIISHKPEGVKGQYLKKVSLSSTMGAGIELNLSSDIYKS